MSEKLFCHAGINMAESEGFDRAASLGYAVARVGRLFGRALERELSAFGVALGQFPVLLLLWEEEGVTQSEIARRLDFEQPTIANTLSRMLRDGLVSTAADPSHGRRLLIYLTDRGRNLRKPLTDLATAMNAKAAAGLSSRDKEDFMEILDLIAKSLEEIIG